MASSKSTPRSHGFSLVELLIVVVIILILVAISVSSFSRSQESASEAAAVGSMRAIATSQIIFQTTYQGYAPTLDALGPPKPGMRPSPAAADLVDSALASGYRNGYHFTYGAWDRNGDGLFDNYEVNAEPESNPKARPHFFMDESGVIRIGAGQKASRNSKPVGGEVNVGSN